MIIFYIDPKVTDIFLHQGKNYDKKNSDVSVSNNFVGPNEIIAQIVEVDDPEDAKKYLNKELNFHKIKKYVPLKAGDDVIYDGSEKIYRSLAYGFAKFEKESSKLTLHYPLMISKDKIKAYYLVHPSKLEVIPTYKEVMEVLSENLIRTSLDENDINKQLEKIDLTDRKINNILVAKGKEPVHGYPEHYLPVFDAEKKPGELKEDGSIDYRSLDFIIQVKKNQEILKHIQGIEPEDGFDIYGETIKGILQKKAGFTYGDNITLSLDGSSVISQIDGCIEISNKKVSVVPIALIKGDVDYKVGNIDFEGTVHITGSVLSGFSVKATESIIIEQSVDDASLVAGGNITVNYGIGGKGKTNVIADGSIKAKFVLNSTIEAGGEINISDSVINSNTYSHDKINVTEKHGKIIGGETVALHKISANVSGSDQENKTVLTVGKDLILEREINYLKDRTEDIMSQIEDLKNYIPSLLGESFFINPKVNIQKLGPEKKKLGMVLINALDTCIKELKKVKDEYRHAEKMKYEIEEEPSVNIYKDAHPGTVIKIKDLKNEIIEKISNAKFYEDAENQIISFTSAV